MSASAELGDERFALTFELGGELGADGVEELGLAFQLSLPLGRSERHVLVELLLGVIREAVEVQLAVGGGDAEFGLNTLNLTMAAAQHPIREFLRCTLVFIRRYGARYQEVRVLLQGLRLRGNVWNLGLDDISFDNDLELI